MFLFLSNRKFLFSILLAIICITFRQNLEVLFHSINVPQGGTDHLLTHERLGKYNGITEKRLFLSILGSVFDVTKGIQHYGPGAPYHYFVGKDGSRAFITGNFKDESDSKDHVLDLPCSDLFILLNWRQALSDKYEAVGKLIGRFYNSDGEKTEYSKQLYGRVDQCDIERQAAKFEDYKLPPCNVEWNVDTGTRVWCSKTSGGVKRKWTGVPRQLYTPGQEHPRCVCINVDETESVGLLKEYDNCPPTHIECTVRS